MSCKQIETRVKGRNKAIKYIEQFDAKDEEEPTKKRLKTEKDDDRLNEDKLASIIEKVYEDLDESRLTMSDIQSNLKPEIVENSCFISALKRVAFEEKGFWTLR